jgi:hypothetical protein
VRTAVTDDRWHSVGDYHERVAAEAIRGVLAAAGMPCYIRSDAHLPGLGSAFSVRVPAALAGSARELLAHEPISEAELTELALREPPDDAADA